MLQQWSTPCEKPMHGTMRTSAYTMFRLKEPTGESRLMMNKYLYSGRESLFSVPVSEIAMPIFLTIGLLVLVNM